MPQINKGASIWDHFVKTFEKDFLKEDGVRQAMERLVKSGVNRDRLVKGLMHTVADIEALEDIRPKARKREKSRRRRLKDLAPCLMDAAQRLEEATIYFNLSTLLGRNLRVIVDDLRNIS
jgi:hypothetical protein